MVFLFPPQFAMAEVLVTSLLDEFYQHVIRIFKKKELFVLVICGAACLLGIPCVFQVQIIVSCMNLTKS